MKPNFALTLSFDGIRLLHRSPSGWTVVGEVPLDEPGLAGALAALRATAVGLEPGGIRTKVMLPAEQVKLLDAPEPGEAAARAVLEGATPYAASDLVIDHASVEGRHRVAAVARETLDEAEAFAAGHRFHPVSFAAVLPEDGFPGEAFFGETRLARAGAERVERDATPTVPRGPRVPSAGGRPAAASTGEGNAEPGPPLEPALASAAANRDEPVSMAAASDAASPGAAVPSVLDAPLSPTGLPQPAFASRSRVMPDPMARAEPRPTPLRAPERGAFPPPPAAATREPSAGRPTEPPLRSGGLAPQPDQRSQAGSPSRVAGPSAPARVTYGAAAAPAASPAPEPVLAAQPAPRRGAPRAAEIDVASEPGRSRGKPRFLGLILTALLLFAMLTVGVLASSSQQRIAGLLGLVDDPTTPPRPSAATAGPALEPDVAPLASAELPTPVLVTAEAPPPSVGREGTDHAIAAVAAAIKALPVPVPAAAPSRSVSPAEVDRIHAATGVWLGSPRLPASPQVAAAELVVPASAAASRPNGASPAKLVRVVAEAGPMAPPAPPVPRTAPVRVASVSTAPDGVVTPTAVTILAEAPPLLPPTRPRTPAPEAPEIVADSAPTASSGALAEPPSRRPATRPTDPDLPDAMRVATAPVAPPDEPGAASDGATDDATAQLLTPSATPATASPPADRDVEAGAAGDVGLRAFEGARPPPRPDGLAPEAPEALASFDGPRPGLRPEGLAPEQPAEAPVVTEDGTDPEAIASAVAAAQAAAPPPAVDRAPTVDVQSALASIVAGAPDPLAGATPQAVAVARVPDARPRNFDRVVRDQLSRTARAAQPAAAPPAASPEEAEASGTEVASAAAVPSGATAQSVAQAATFADVMALREVNLIGVFGQPSNRRALVRMGNGRYMRVGVGDSLDGGQVTAIGDNALNYTKRGRQLQLVIPGG